MSYTHTYHSRVSRCIWNALCHFQTIHANISIMHILTKFNSHTSCYSIHDNNIKISSYGLITIQAIHFESPKQHKNSHTTHVNSRTLGSTLFTATLGIIFTRFKYFENENMAIQASTNPHPLKWLLAKE